MNELLETLRATFANQFLSGGAALMILGALMALCRRLPYDLWHCFKRQVTVSVDVVNTDPVFDWFSAWLDAHAYSKRAKRLTISSVPSPVEDGARTVIFTPAPGNHFFFYRGRFVWLNRERNAAAAGKSDDGGDMPSGTMRQRETYTLTILGRSQKVARLLVEEARRVSLATAKAQAELYVSNCWFWQKQGAIRPRPLDSVVLPGDAGELIVADVREFLDSREWYFEKGVPYRRGYLFYGVPGAGKTSLIGSLAASMGLNLYMLNIGGAGMSDEKLANLLMEVKDNSIVLLEDIDAAVNRPLASDASTNTLQKGGITFSGLLNVLDGVNAREGVMVFMTTNHIGRLDPALIRSGRVDFRYEFKHATREQITKLFRRFYSDADASHADHFCDRLKGRTLSMSDIQQHFLNFKRCHGQAIEHAGQIGASENIPVTCGSNASQAYFDSAQCAA